jgi:hypothetical protein
MTSIIPSSDKVTYNLPATYSNVSTNVRVERSKNVCDLRIELGDGTVFSSATGIVGIVQLPSDCRPSAQKYGTLIAKTIGQWASATYYIASIVIDTNGNVYINGNVDNMKQCQYITGNLTYLL